MQELNTQELDLIAAGEGGIIPDPSDYWQQWLEDWKRLHPDIIIP